MLCSECLKLRNDDITGDAKGERGKSQSAIEFENDILHTYTCMYAFADARMRQRVTRYGRFPAEVGAK